MMQSPKNEIGNWEKQIKEREAVEQHRSEEKYLKFCWLLVSGVKKARTDENDVLRFGELAGIEPVQLTVKRPLGVDLREILLHAIDHNVAILHGLLHDPDREAMLDAQIASGWDQLHSARFPPIGGRARAWRNAIRSSNA